MSLNRRQRGVRKDGGITNPNLAMLPYIASGFTGDVQFKGVNGALSSSPSFNFTASVLATPFLKALQVYTTKQTFIVVGASPTQVVNLDNGSYIVLDLTGASDTLTLTLSNGRMGGSYFIQVVQAATKVDISLANEGRFDGVSGSTIVGVNSINYAIVPLFTGTGYLLNIAQLT